MPLWVPETQILQDRVAEFRSRLGIQWTNTVKVPEFTPEEKQEEKNWWDKPVDKIGEGISHVPMLPKALEFVSPAFEWIHENLEKPFAAIITSPFAPDLPWKKGESWLDHKKREYDMWDAPKYVKGATEFAMPLWWMPWFSWAKAGAKALSVGQKSIAIAAKTTKPLTVAEKGLPSSELLDKVLFKSSKTGGIIRAIENVPVVNKIAKVIGGKGVFVDPKATDAVSITNKELVKYGYILDMRGGVASLLTPKLQAMGKMNRILGMDAKGVVSNIVDLDGKSQYLYDILEGSIKNKGGYKFLTKESEKYVDTLQSILDDIYSLARKEGVRVPKTDIVHRIVKGKYKPSGEYEASEFGSWFEAGRQHKLMKEGVEAGVDYGLDINESVTSTINHYMRKIAERRFNRKISLLGKTPNMMWKSSPEGLELSKLLADPQSVLKYGDRIKALTAQKKVFMNHYKGRQIIGEGLAKFKDHPTFKNTLFPKDVVKTAEKVLNDTGQDWLRTMSSISGTSRMLVAAMDLSAPFIQGLAVLGANPVAWAKSVKNMLVFAAKPENFYKYMTNPEIYATRFERIMAGGSSSTFEYFQALAPLQRAVGKIPGAGKKLDKLIGATYGRAETAFTGFGEVARNNMWLALKRPNMTPEQLGDLARTIDRMTGVMSTEALAIGRTQQDFENAFVFFSPRYTRAGLSFVADTLKGGMTGAEARKAIGAMMGGGLAMYYGASKALGQEPNLNPNSGRFLTIKVGDSHIGIGGIMIALMRFGYDIAATAAEDPQNLFIPISQGKLNRWDNPFIRFMFGRTAPLTSTLYSSVVEQANYFGEPFETVGDWARFMRDKVTPIAFQNALRDPRPETISAEVAGMRAFPMSPWELLDEERDTIAVREFKKPYDELNDLYQMKVDGFSTIRKLQKDVDAQIVSRGDAESVAFLNWERERESARTVYEETVNNLQKAFDAGAISGYDFREKLSEAGYGLGATYDHIINQPEYKGVRDILSKPRKIGDKSVQDVAYAEYMDVMFSGGLEDEFGIFDYDKYNNFLDNFMEKYGGEIYQYVLDMKAERDANMPPLYHEYQKAKEVLRPYWQIQDNVERMFGKYFAESTKGTRLITRLRRAMKIQNPEVARYIELFYSRG